MLCRVRESFYCINWGSFFRVSVFILLRLSARKCVSSFNSKQWELMKQLTNRRFYRFGNFKNDVSSSGNRSHRRNASHRVWRRVRRIGDHCRNWSWAAGNVLTTAVPIPLHIVRTNDRHQLAMPNHSAAAVVGTGLWIHFVHGTKLAVDARGSNGECRVGEADGRQMYGTFAVETICGWHRSVGIADGRRLRAYSANENFYSITITHSGNELPPFTWMICSSRRFFSIEQSTVERHRALKLASCAMRRLFSFSTSTRRDCISSIFRARSNALILCSAASTNWAFNSAICALASINCWLVFSACFEVRLARQMASSRSLCSMGRKVVENCGSIGMRWNTHLDDAFAASTFFEERQLSFEQFQLQVFLLQLVAEHTNATLQIVHGRCLWRNGILRISTSDSWWIRIYLFDWNVVAGAFAPQFQRMKVWMRMKCRTVSVRCFPGVLVQRTGVHVMVVVMGTGQAFGTFQ